MVHHCSRGDLYQRHVRSAGDPAPGGTAELGVGGFEAAPFVPFLRPREVFALGVG